MIGNDVIDLRDPETSPSTRHRRFDERVFAPRERERLAESAEPERLRWTLWAAKEAAFKAAKRIDGGVVFSPRRFVVDLERGSVVHETGCYAIDVTSTEEAIHVVARLETIAASAVLAGFMETGDLDQSAAVRRLALAGVAECLGARAQITHTSGSRAPLISVSASPRWGEAGAKRRVRGGRRGSLPLTRASRDLSPTGRGELPLSLSHHGRFIAFAALAEITA